MPSPQSTTLTCSYALKMPHRQQAPGKAEGSKRQARLHRDVHDRAGHGVGNDLRHDAGQAVHEPRCGADETAKQAGALRRSHA